MLKQTTGMHGTRFEEGFYVGLISRDGKRLPYALSGYDSSKAGPEAFAWDESLSFAFFYPNAESAEIARCAVEGRGTRCEVREGFRVI